MQIIECSKKMKRFLPKSSLNPSGFTLIELLIVISILAVLATIGFVVFSNIGAQAKSRNIRRRTDLDSIAKALEVNKAPNGGNYPILLPTYFANDAIPTDPTSTNVYCANSVASAQPGDPATWTTTCPAGYGTLGTNPLAGTAWKVCVSLEAEVNPTVAPGVACKLSAQ